MNGGMQRCFHIINQLATYFHLSLIIFQDKNSFQSSIRKYPAIANIKIYSTKEKLPVKDLFSVFPLRFKNALRYRWLKRQISSPADSMFLEYYPVLKTLLKHHKYDTIIVENLATLNAISIIHKYMPNVKIIYDAHNVDSKLAIGSTQEDAIRKRESTLYRDIDALITCSEKDRIDFIQMNKKPVKAEVIPNGVNIAEVFDEGVREENPRFILFCGSLYSFPNREGLLWFYKNVWTDIKGSFPRLKLLIVGIGELPLDARLLIHDPSLVFSGAVDDVKLWYNKAAIAIVPLLTGSGTRLKILEAMSLGLPVVSTSKGAEGIHYTDKQNIIIADGPDSFSESVINLLKNQGQRKTIAKEARKLVEKEYDWNLIGQTLKKFIESV